MVISSLCYFVLAASCTAKTHDAAETYRVQDPGLALSWLLEAVDKQKNKPEEFFGDQYFPQ